MIFWTLLLAHVIGDFPLQTDSIYRLKLKSFWGVIPHVAICTLANILLMKPFWSNGYVWVAIIFLAVIHAFLDRAKIFVSGLLSKDNLLHFAVDQALHFLSIWIVSLWLSQHLDPSRYTLTGIYANRSLIIMLTALIFASYGGTPIVYYAQKYWINHKASSPIKLYYPSLTERLPGLLERFIATLAVIGGGWWTLFSVGIFFPRILFNLDSNSRLLPIVNGIVGFLLSISCGYITKILI